MYPGREIYPNAPLEYVAVEVRYPYAPRFRQQETLDSVLLDVQDLFPIIRQQGQIRLAGAIGGPLTQQVDQVSRAFNRASTTAVLITSTALTVDTTSYTEFENFRAVVARCVQAASEHGSIAAVERIGLRYVDEIRVPSAVADARDWRGWISDDLLAGINLGGDAGASLMEGGVQFSTGNERVLAVRYVASPQGTGVIGDGPLRRRHPLTEGPFFALDLDSYWQPTPEDAPAFEPALILDTIDALHAPVGATFQRAITDRLREEVLRRDSHA